MNILTFGNKKTVVICKIDLVELLHDKYESKVVIHIGRKETSVTFKYYEDALKLYYEINQMIQETNEKCNYHQPSEIHHAST